jgi:hypothetical protein
VGSILADLGFDGGDQPDVAACVPVAVNVSGPADRLVDDPDVVGGLHSSVRMWEAERGGGAGLGDHHRVGQPRLVALIETRLQAGRIGYRAGRGQGQRGCALDAGDGPDAAGSGSGGLVEVEAGGGP